METPFRQLQKRVKDLEEISKGHQEQVKQELKDFNTLCHILTITKFLDNARASQIKQARDIVDINYVA